MGNLHYSSLTSKVLQSKHALGKRNTYETLAIPNFWRFWWGWSKSSSIILPPCSLGRRSTGLVCFLFINWFQRCGGVTWIILRHGRESNANVWQTAEQPPQYSDIIPTQAIFRLKPFCQIAQHRSSIIGSPTLNYGAFWKQCCDYFGTTDISQEEPLCQHQPLRDSFTVVNQHQHKLYWSSGKRQFWCWPFLLSLFLSTNIDLMEVGFPQEMYKTKSINKPNMIWSSSESISSDCN